MNPFHHSMRDCRAFVASTLSVRFLQRAYAPAALIFSVFVALRAHAQDCYDYFSGTFEVATP